MHKQLQKWILALSLLMLGHFNSAYALTSTGADGAFKLNNALTLNASNNKTFNFTTFDLETGGTLDFSGLTNQDSIFILATGDIHLDGIFNLSSNVTFETAGSIFITGVINVDSTNSITLGTSGAGTIDLAKDAAIIFKTTVPEPSSYALLLAGISLFMLRRNKFSN